MASPTPSEKVALFLLSSTLLLGIGISYFKNVSPLSLQVTPSLEAVEKVEKDFEIAKQVSLSEGREEDFARLPHIGPQLARRIVDYRETHGFQKKEDILKVKGIGAKTYEEVKDLLVLE